MHRDPSLAVKKQLRKEVGFGCPVPGCQNPFLTWHHFDPPWRVLKHHNPDGMIALCTVHHPQADAGAFTKEQLHQFKINAQSDDRNISNKFEWMRNKILIYGGGVHYLETYNILKIKEQKIIWLNRDENGYLLLNIHPIATSPGPRFVMENNFWLVHGNQKDLECPPSGRLIRIEYPNGDKFSVEFREMNSEDDLRKKYPDAHPEVFNIETPITTIEITYRIAGISLDIGPNHTQIGGIRMKGGFVNQAHSAFIIK